MTKLIIEFPATAPVPEGLEADQDFLRYTIAATLYARERISGRQARELTGDTRRTFEEKMARYVFALQPGRPQDVSAELNA
jgi:hypothetical protein